MFAAKVRKSVSIIVIERNLVALKRTRDQPAHLCSTIPKLCAITQQTNARVREPDAQAHLQSIAFIGDRAQVRSIAYDQR